MASGKLPREFDELRLQVRRATEEAIGPAIGILVAALRQSSGSPLHQMLPGAADTALMLLGNVNFRIARSLETFDLEVSRRLAGEPAQVQTTRTGQLAQRLTEAMCQARPYTYARYVAGMCGLSPIHWRSGSGNPLSAQVTVQSFLSAIADVLQAPSLTGRGTGAFESAELISELGRALSAVYVTGESYLDVRMRLDAVGTLPHSYDETEPPAKASTKGATAADTHSDGPGHASAQTNPGSQNADVVTDHNEFATTNAEADVQLETGAHAGARPRSPAAGTSMTGTTPPQSDDGFLYTTQAWRADSPGRRLGVSTLAAAPQGPGLTQLATLQPVADMERDAIAFAHAIGEVPYSRDSRRRYFAQVRERLAQGGTTPAQLALVDLVSAMFDYVVDDRRLTDSARPLVWRLQQPALMLTLLDSAYLSDDKRSVRQLVEHFGAIVSTFGAELARGSELYHRLETVVRALEVISSVLHLRANVLAEQVSKEYQRCAASMAQLVDRIRRQRQTLESTPDRHNRRDYSRRPGRDEERVVTDQLAAEMSARLRRHDVPDTVRAFLEQVWLLHMRTTRLRDGPDSPEYRAAAGVVDELIWTLHQDGEKNRRRELAQRIPGLIDELMRGMRLIGVREEEHQAFFDELFLLHLHKLQRRRDSPASKRVRKHPETGPAKTAQARPGAAEYDLAEDIPLLDEMLPGDGNTTASVALSDSTKAGSVFDNTTINASDSSAVETLKAAITTVSPDPDTLAASTTLTVAGQRPVSQSPPAALVPMIELPVHEYVDTTATGFVSETGGSAYAGARDPDRAGASRLSEHSTHFRLTTRIAGQTAPVTVAGGEIASNDDAAQENHLVNLLSSTGLGDLPRRPRYLGGAVDTVFSQIQPGSWMELRGTDDRVLWLKVAWINARGSMFLLMRHPDRRTLSRSAPEIRNLLATGSLRLLVTEQVAGL